MKALPPDFKLFVILLGLSVFIFLFDKLELLNLPKSLLEYLTIPVQYGLYQSGNKIGRQFEFIALSKTATLENKALKTQLADLLTENALLQKQLKEETELVDQYNKLSPETYDLLPARIIGTGRYLVIDRGTTDGVKMNQVVVFKDNYIGKIQKVDPKTAQVMLSFDPDSKIAVFSQNKEGNARGILTGQFGSELLMDKILHQEIISQDDIVYSEGSEGNLPRGLIMGKVTAVLDRQNEVFKQAKVEPIFKSYDLDIIFVIRGN